MHPRRVHPAEANQALVTKAGMYLLLSRRGAKVDADLGMVGTADLHVLHLEIAVKEESTHHVRDVRHHENTVSANLDIPRAEQIVENDTPRIQTNTALGGGIPSASLAEENMPLLIASDVPNGESLIDETDTRNDGNRIRSGTNGVVIGPRMNDEANEIRNVENDTGDVQMRNDASLDIGEGRSVKMGNAGRRGDILSENLDVRTRKHRDDDVILKLEMVGGHQGRMIGVATVVTESLSVNQWRLDLYPGYIRIA